jgi:hypothetical protein
MVVTYYLEAVLATIYLLVLLPGRLGIWKLHSGSPRPLVRVIEAFKDSSKTFLDMTTIFSLAMLASAISSNAHSIYEKKKSGYGEFVGVYSNIVCLQLPIFSVFPTILLHNIVQGLRRLWLRQLVMILMFVMSLIILVMAEKTRPRPYEQDQWESLCDTERGKMILPALMAMCGIFRVATVFWLCCLKNILQLPALGNSRLLHTVARYWSPLLAVLCCGGMWLMLGLFMAYRDHLIAVATTDNAGEIFGTTKDEEESWTFGQYLALATFFPIFLDFGCILFSKCLMFSVSSF